MELGLPLASKRFRKERNLHEPSVEVSQVTEMSGIWEHFPEDLLEIVLTLLPIAILFRFRLVCQRWNSLLASPNFIQRWGELAMHKQPWFLAKAGGVGAGSLYDPFTKKWLDTPFMPLSTSDTFPLASARGLVCFLNAMHTFLFIGNPFTQCWRALSCSSSTIVNMQARGFIATGMVTIEEKDYGRSTWRCKVVLVNNRGDYEVYTALKDLESPSHLVNNNKIPSCIKWPHYLSPRALTIGTKLLFLGSHPHGITTYDVESGAWAQILIPAPPNSSDLALIECKGRMLLTGAVKDTSTISVRVWKLETKLVRTWKEVDRMPSSLCSDFIGKANAFYECLCNKNVIMISLRTPRMNRLFTYDVVSREWSKVPRIVLPCQRRLTIVNGVGFFPCFSLP